MKKQLKIAFFNIAFILLSILCFSKRTLGLGFSPSIGTLKFALSVSLSVIGILCFFYINFLLITSKDAESNISSKFSSIDKCIASLEKCKQTDPAFIQEIETAIKQLHILRRRENALFTLLEHNDASESFCYLKDTGSKANLYVFNNIKRITNRLIVFDNDEFSESNQQDIIQPHKEYIHEVLKDTDNILKEYNKLLLAVSSIGDANKTDISEMHSMTEALNYVLQGQHIEALEKKYALKTDEYSPTQYNQEAYYGK